MATFNSSPSYEADEGIVMHGDAVEEPRDEGEGNEREDTSPQKERSVFDDLSLFRDFFISAFSDNVSNDYTYCTNFKFLILMTNSGYLLWSFGKFL